MGNWIINHSDCENFAAIDVDKGICRLSGQLIKTDGDVCEKFEQIPKCRNCIYFKNEQSDGIGSCTGLKKEYWIDGNYKASLCEAYHD
ncbi:4-hydroxyphenylacetate decarboxylase small subunit [Acetitomaculum ruminis DSM 5522]|uniref:4-hydroxyphenylacetate decarboxylase small subunit n=1 Tax=Acetitomaculum ruminis DSM 5522 TaxID=1120918 RepID=A0A1I1A1X1_9FIRM|nr:4-hydroxyphenylacetate decarboxylase small subunit [Acetitomaculum ruminis]SFB31975.1 4-hydroxyphenylacetate decarboxylase small subunit [Acetitomaculum ruminis DSM 5522]